MGTFSDSFSVSSQEVVLSSDWQSFSLDLEAAVYDSGIVNAFSCTVDLSHNSAPLIFYVDDLVIE